MRNNVDITPDLVKEHGLKPDEYERILALIGRDADIHRTRHLLGHVERALLVQVVARMSCATLPTKAPRVIQGPGENAGVVDIGDGLACVFKMESHNHPSFIEPYQGAATGVGGILRDVFTMGARPIAALNALRFGEPDHPKTRHLVSGVVAGIGGYGNSFGVPTVGGEVEFRPALQRQHPGQRHGRRPRQDGRDLLCGGEGRRPAGRLSRLQDRPRRHPRRDHGVGRIRRRLEEKRPTVQVGDPFTEKLLLEACLELMATGRGDRHPGHGRGRPHLLGGRDGRQGRPRHRARPRQGAVPRRRA